MDKSTQYYLADVKELIPYARNARTHSDEQIAQIAASIREFGFLSPIIVSKDNTILCGHGRFYAAQRLGLEKVPCIKEEYLTETQRRAYILADNKLSLNAGWDNEMLAVELEDLQNSFDINLIGFDAKELAALFDDGLDAKDDDFDVDEELKKPCFSKAGDLWHLGKHRLVCGDSTKVATYELLMDGKEANLVVTDPPYNVNYEGSAGKIKNDNMENSAFYQFLLDAFINTEKVMAQDASIYVFHADTEGLNFRRAFADAGFYLSGTCIWKKQSLVLGRSPYQWQHEPVLFGWKRKGKHEWYTGRKESTIWEFDKPKKNGDHPTMKPVPLLAYPIKNSSMSNCIVLDPFGGSGSTLIACEQTNRICFTTELDEKYCDVIVKRYIEQVGSSSEVMLERDGVLLQYDEVPGASS
jgi:DNA modification methylase|nr:MAG TPA: adenine specific DNA methyltransferase [Caudoviricetes sp.]